MGVKKDALKNGIKKCIIKENWNITLLTQFPFAIFCFTVVIADHFSHIERTTEICILLHWAVVKTSSFTVINRKIYATLGAFFHVVAIVKEEMKCFWESHYQFNLHFLFANCTNFENNTKCFSFFLSNHINWNSVLFQEVSTEEH